MHNLKFKKNKNQTIPRSQTLVFDHMMEGCQIIGYDLKYIYLNDAADVHNRRPKEELLGKSYTEVWPGVNNTDVYRAIKESLEARKYLQMENEFVFPGGAAAWFDLRIQPIPEGVFILSIDITDRKKTMQKLAESEKLFRNLFENMLNGFAYCKMIYDDDQLPDFIYVNVNKTFETLTGLKNVEGKKATVVIPGIQQSDHELLEKYKRVSTTGKPEIFEIWVEALKMWFLISVYCPQKGFFVAVFDVITDRKKAEAALVESEDRFRSLYENVSIGIYRTTLDGRIMMANTAMVNMLGFDSFEELSLRNLEQEGYEPDYPRTKFLETVENQDNIIVLESAWRQRDGKIIYVRESARAIRDSNGNTLYYDGTAEDITERKLIEEALRESEDKFKYIFDHSVIGKSLTSVTGEVQLNAAFCKMLGYTSEEMANLKWQDFTHPDDFDITENVIKSTLAGNSDSSRITKRYIRKDGSIIWTDVSTRLRRDNKGNPLYFMTSVNDITENKRAETELKLQSEIMSHMIEAVYLVRMEDGIIVYTNSRFEELFGYGPGEMAGRNVAIVNAPTEKSPEETAREIMNDLEEKGLWRGEVYNIKKDGTPFWTHANVTLFDHSKFGRVLIAVQEDITDRKKAESQIKRLNEELEERVILRTEQLEAVNKELESFSYSVSHDLRAPLRAVHGYTKILVDEYENILDEEGKRICRIISSSATQMGELIDDLLSFSRIGRTGMNTSQLDMKSIVMSVFKETCPNDQKSKTNLKIGKLHKALGDGNLLKIVWTNLISNAIKYSSKESISEISVSSQMKYDRITYSVKDNGVGFDMNYKHKLFGVFQRLHSEAEFEGNGVGLAIVQRIILKHGGNVWAEGEVGKGATFYFSLPVNGEDKNEKVNRRK